MTTLMVALKKRSHMQKSHPKVVNPRDIAGERRKKKSPTLKAEVDLLLVHRGHWMILELALTFLFFYVLALTSIGLFKLP